MKGNEKVLSDIFFDRVHINFEECNHLKEAALLGEELNIPARELVLIYFDIKKKFKIEIPEKEIINGNFKTYRKISRMIDRLITDN